MTLKFFSKDEERWREYVEEEAKRREEQKKLLDENPILVMCIQNRQREWMQKNQEEPKELIKKALPYVDDDELIEDFKRMRINGEEILAPEKHSRMADEQDKSLELRHWEEGISTLGSDYEDFYEEHEQVQARLIDQPESGTQENWERLIAKAEPLKYKEIAESSESEKQPKARNFFSNTPNAIILRSWRADLKMVAPDAYAAKQNQDAARKELERWGPITKITINESKEQLSAKIYPFKKKMK